jgi:hypothetical protein
LPPAFAAPSGSSSFFRPGPDVSQTAKPENIFVPLIREITKSERYFTHNKIAIALYIGFVKTLLENNGILIIGTVGAAALVLYLFIVYKDKLRKTK